MSAQWLYLIVGTVVSFLILEGTNLGLLFFEKYRWVQVPCTCKFLELRHNVKGGISGSKITVIAIPKIFISKDFWIQSNSKTSLRQTFTRGLIWIFKNENPSNIANIIAQKCFSPGTESTPRKSPSVQKPSIQAKEEEAPFLSRSRYVAVKFPATYCCVALSLMPSFHCYLHSVWPDCSPQHNRNTNMWFNFKYS